MFRPDCSTKEEETRCWRSYRTIANTRSREAKESPLEGLRSGWVLRAGRAGDVLPRMSRYPVSGSALGSTADARTPHLNRWVSLCNAGHRRKAHMHPWVK